MIAKKPSRRPVGGGFARQTGPNRGDMAKSASARLVVEYEARIDTRCGVEAFQGELYGRLVFGDLVVAHSFTMSQGCGTV